MSAIDYHEYQRAVRWMEDGEAKRRSISVKLARPVVARQIGIAPGTLEDIRKGRLKSLRGCVERAIDAAFVRLLQNEIGQLNHELAMASARRAPTDRGPMAKAMATRDALNALLSETQ